jgi:hypothetical protein
MVVAHLVSISPRWDLTDARTSRHTQARATTLVSCWWRGFGGTARGQVAALPEVPGRNIDRHSAV